MNADRTIQGVHDTNGGNHRRGQAHGETDTVVVPPGPVMTNARYHHAKTACVVTDAVAG